MAQADGKRAFRVGVAGPVVVTLPTPIFNSEIDCVDIDPAVYADIAANPSNFYVNVHTEAFPNGALRGQLGAAPATPTAARFAPKADPAGGSATAVAGSSIRG